MATISYQAQSGTWSGTFNLNYSAVYDRAKNQTTITFENCTAVYSSALGWASTTETTITVKNEAGTKKTVTLNTELKNTDAGGGTKTFIATPNPASVILDHSAGVGKKTVELSSHTLFTLRPYSDSSLMRVGGDSETVTITSAELFTMTKSAGTGSVITVNNQTSGKNNLANRALVAAGDVLQIFFTAAQGYVSPAGAVNGKPINSGDTVTVVGNITVSSTAIPAGGSTKINGQSKTVMFYTKISRETKQVQFLTKINREVKTLS